MNKNLENVSCNLCGEENYRVLFKRGDLSEEDPQYFAKITTDHYSSFGCVVRCGNCGLVYLNPRFSKETIESAYAQLEDSDYMDQRECRGTNARLALETIKKFKRGGKLLDIGAATGYLLNASRVAFESFGVEPSKWACDFIGNYIKVKTHEGTFETADFPSDEFDVVSMVDVLEHFHDPKINLIKAAGIMKKGGLLYIVTPDIDSLSAKIMGRYWWGLRPAHLYYFSGKTLERMLREIGFEVVLRRSYGRMFSMAYWLSRLNGYPSIIYKSMKWLISTANISDKVIYINTRDSMEICAIKK